MRRLTLLFTMILPFCAAAQYRTPGYVDLSESEMVREMKTDVGYLASAALEGRAAGSEGELEAARYMGARLSELGVTMLYGEDGDTFGIQQENGDTLRSRNVAAFIPGYDKVLKDNYIVLCARLDNLARQLSA